MNEEYLLYIGKRNESGRLGKVRIQESARRVMVSSPRSVAESLEENKCFVYTDEIAGC